MSALICGSFAFDTIMVFQDHFKNHILPDKVHILNVAFHVPEMRREFGGCAANIAYNLKLLGGDPLPMGTVGKDFEPYAAWLDQHGIPRTHIKEMAGCYTAQAFITTDQDDNQITAFHPGAMDLAHEVQVSDAEGVTLGIVSPDGRQGMIDHAEQFAEAGIPFIFDPGQAMPLFNKDDFRNFIKQATWVCVNDYESQLLQERTGWSPHEIAEKVEALIVTRGAKGSYIYASDDGRIEIPPRRGQRRGRSHRLRRCLPRRPAVRIDERAGLGSHRAHRGAHGGHQDRAPRHPESQLHHGRVPQALSAQLRHGPGSDLSAVAIGGRA